MSRGGIRRQRPNAGRSVATAAVALVALALLAAPGSASAAVTCTVTGATLQIGLGAPGDRGELSTADVAIVVGDGDGQVACSGVLPTVHTIDLIVVDDTSGGDTAFSVSGPGAFGPGAEDEPGLSDEIEIRMLMGAGTDTVYLINPPSSTGADFWRLGSTDDGKGVNLNVASEPGTMPGRDVDLRWFDVESMRVYLAGGNDRMLANGGPEFQGPLPTAMEIDPSEGNDVLVGGLGDDQFLQFNGSGDDDLTGNTGSDTFVYGDSQAGPVRLDLRLSGRQDTGAAGHDLVEGVENAITDIGADVLIGTDAYNKLRASDGNDVLSGLGGSLDHLNGGRGSDTASYAIPPAGAAAGVNVDLGLDLTPQNTGGAGTDVLEEIENFIGSPFGDTVRGSASPNRIEIRDGVSDTVVSCLGDSDTVVADVEGVDSLAADCEIRQFDFRPDTTIVSGPPGLSNDATPSFTFSATKAGSTFQCSLDAGPFAACSSEAALAKVSDGAHLLRVQARDILGALDLSPAARPFSVDTKAPVITRARADRRLRRRQGSSIRYRLSEQASVKIALQRCRQLSRSTKRCTRYGNTRNLERSGKRGANRNRFKTGRRGLYRATLTATDLALNTSKQERLNFRVGA